MDEQKIVRYTQYELRDLVRRCFEECKKNKAITLVSPGLLGKEVEALTDKNAVIEHIAKTIIGELFELEILRKLGPTIRQQKSIEADMEFLEKRADEEWRRQNLRVGEDR